MKKQNVFVEINDITWEEVNNGVKRKIMAYDDKLMVVRVEFEKGSIGTIHKHYHSQITNIESGRFEISIGDKRKILQSGDAFYIPPNTDHGCVCIEKGVLIDVFSPMRKDFITSDGSKDEIEHQS